MSAQSKPDRAVFLDRDGTINEEVGHLNDSEHLRLTTGAAEAIRLLNAAQFRVVIVTNQSSVARGSLSEDALGHLHDEMLQLLGASGAHIDAIYYCPHHPTEGVLSYRTECDCRKPKPGMLLRAAEELHLDLGRSYAVGDAMSDLEAAHAAGCRFVLVRTGYGQRTVLALGQHAAQPDYVAKDLYEAAAWIVQRQA